MSTAYQSGQLEHEHQSQEFCLESELRTYNRPTPSDLVLNGNVDNPGDVSFPRIPPIGIVRPYAAGNLRSYPVGNTTC